MKNRIFLSPPHMGGEELIFIKEAFESNYIAPLGPMVNAFEKEFSEFVGIKHCAAVSSGTAAMHLGLRHLGVGHLIQGSGVRGQGEDQGAMRRQWSVVREGRGWLLNRQKI